MVIRFLIVVLAILNVGVALWWLAPKPAAAPVPARAEPGVATLELLPHPQSTGAVAQPVDTAMAMPAKAPETDPAVAVDVPAASPAAAVAPSTTPVPAPAPPPAVVQECLRLGPFAAEAEAKAALARLAGMAERPRLHEVPGKAASGYRVLIPAAASREDAQATVKRIVDAGFSDYFIIAQGDDANAIALGQYRNREGAERRLASLAAAGFAATLVPSGNETPARWWIDAALAAGTGAAAAMRQAGATQQQSLDCARLR